MHGRHREVGPDAGQLELDVCIELIKALVASELRTCRADHSRELAARITPCLLGHGTLPVTLSCIEIEEAEELFHGDAEVEFTDPLQVVELQFIFPNARFPRAGEYRFQLSALGQILRERKFLVSYL